MEEKKYLKVEVELLNTMYQIIGQSKLLSPFEFMKLDEQIKQSEPIEEEVYKRDEEGKTEEVDKGETKR